MNLKILNQAEPNVLLYLPYGVTTLEMKVEGEEAEVYGFIYPDKRADAEKKLYVGYADQSENFLVLWGAGKEGGLNINSENIGGRLFLQILHKGKSIERQSITLYHSQTNTPIGIIKLVPADENPNLVTMELSLPEEESEFRIITFKGNKMPIYYSRWFPPKPSENGNIQYYSVEVPNIEIKFRVKDDKFISSVNSDIDILLNNNKIAQVTGDLRYSWPHAEIFTIFGDTDYLVVRLWFYWINGNFSKNILSEGNAIAAKIEAARIDDVPPQDVQIRRALWESFDIECPDSERFDFLIDMKKKKITWVGTDFHYQESWYRVDEADSFVRARIANDFNTIEQLFQKLKDRFDHRKENYDPMTRLKEMLRKPEIQKNLMLEDMPEVEEYVVSNLHKNGIVTYKAVGFTRKHVPYIENGNAVAELVSSVVTS